MEKIIVRIGHIGRGSANTLKFDRNFHQDVLWLQDVLEISYKTRY